MRRIGLALAQAIDEGLKIPDGLDVVRACA